MNEVYDAIIVGAGPAGLSVGSELSKKFKILVIDKKENIGDTTKSWFFPKFSYLKDAKDLKPFMYGNIDRLLCKTCTGANTLWKTNLNQGYSFVKENEILTYWGNIIKKNNSQILLNVNFKDHQVNDNLVFVRTSKGNFTSKLLIDASGCNSIIKNKYSFKESNLYYWSVYGAIVEHPNGLDKSLKVNDYMLWQTFKDDDNNEKNTLREGRVVFEYEILRENISFPLILYLKKDRVSKEIMKKKFLEVLYNDETTAAFKDCIIKEHKFGWYPSGGLTQNVAKNNVVFIGDAGCWSTPCGWGMGFIVRNYKKYSKSLSKCLKSNNLDEKSLKKIIKFDTHEKHQILMDEIIVHFLSNGSAGQIDRFIEFFNSLSPLLCEKIFTLTVSRKDLREALKDFLKHFSLKELIGVIPKEDYLILLEEAKYFIEDFLIDEVKLLLHKTSKKEIDVKLRDGFDFD